MESMDLLCYRYVGYDNRATLINIADPINYFELFMMISRRSVLIIILFQYYPAVEYKLNIINTIWNDQ
jgi:hypothetical protein